MEGCVQKTACFIWLKQCADICTDRLRFMFAGLFKYMAVALFDPKLSIHLTVHQFWAFCLFHSKVHTALITFFLVLLSKSWCWWGVRREETMLFKELKVFPQSLSIFEKFCFHKTLLSLKNGLINLEITPCLLHAQFLWGCLTVENLWLIF